MFHIEPSRKLFGVLRGVVLIVEIEDISKYYRIFLIVLGEKLMDANSAVYASPPKEDITIDDCYFYHTTDLPGIGTVKGEWDLRSGVKQYLGNFNFQGRKVLDVGTATGFLSFFMEAEGASVIGYDLAPQHSWDVVPYSRFDFDAHVEHRKSHIKAINNGFWLCHKKFKSNNKLVHGTVYTIPENLDPVDISVFGSILLHLRDPFLALHNVLRITKEAVIVTEIHDRQNFFSSWINSYQGRSLSFKPRFRRNAPWETWWGFSPKVVCEMLGVLGFEEAKTTFHSQPLIGRSMRMFTVVAHRTKPTAPLKF